MLTAAQLDAPSPPGARRSRSLRSPKQRYHHYILQRIEDYKNSVPRTELFRLGEEALCELEAAAEGQLFLTEVLMQETVDRLIISRLGLPSFNRWRSRYAKLRAAQREPTHWGLERRSAIAAVLPRVEAGDHVLVVGAGAEPAAYLLAAHDARVTCLFGDNATATRVENRMAAESLTGDFEAFVVVLGDWFPPLELPVHFAVVDTGALAALPASRRYALVAQVQAVTAAGGLHALVSAAGARAAPEAFVSLYPDWARVPMPGSARRGARTPAALGVLVACPGPPHGAGPDPGIRPSASA